MMQGESSDMTPEVCDPYVRHAHDLAIGGGEGPLAGVGFAVKDIFHVRGLKTGAGNPDWLADHAAALETAPAVQTLQDAGAILRGKTHTDELAFSLMGCNAHYGAPLNPAAPDRVPGGSSSGSAAAVASGRVDIAIGSDTGGSVRVPASFCGLYGMRPSHGRIPCDGMVPLAPSFDTVGWFSRDAENLAAVGTVLLGDDRTDSNGFGTLLVAEDAFSLADAGVHDALMDSLAPIRALFAASRTVTASTEPLSRWRETFRTIQAYEAWQVHGEWIRAAKPAFGPGVRERFAYSATVSSADAAAAQLLRQQLIAPLLASLAGGVVLCLPTCPDVAPLRAADAASLDDFRNRLLELTAIAGLAGLPQLTVPVAAVGDAPVGLSFVAARGGDALLLSLAESIDAISRV
jgi:amidase